MAKKLLSRKSKLAETFLPSSRKNSVERSRNHEVISDHNTKKKQRPFTSHSNSTTIKKRTRPSRRIINDDPKRKQMVEKHRSSNTFSEEIMAKPNQSKVIKKFDTEETPTSSHGKTSEVKLNDVSMKGEQTNPDPMQPSTGWVGENQATDSAALAKMMSQLSGEVLRTSVQQKAELQKEIEKERSEIKEEWNRLKQKIQEEHEEREKFNQIKNEELQKIDEKKREIEEIAKNIENTNKIILKQKEELEREKEDLKKAREESNHNSSQVKYKDVKYDGEKKIHPQAQRIKEQEVHFKKPPRKKSEEKEDTFADKVENQVNKTNKKLSGSHKNDIGEISPVNDDPSISSRKLSPNYQAQINDQEVEVPLDFEDNKMAKDTTSEDENKDVLDDNLIDKMIAEDTALYDASLFFDEQIFDFREKKAQYKIFKVIQTDNPDIGHVIVGSEIVEKDDIIHLRLFCFKDKGEDLDNCEEHVIPLDSIRAMMKLISSKDVLPHNKPIKTTRNYKEFISRFLFSFLAYKKDNDNPNGSESIQIKSNTKGILKREIHVKFCGKECSI